MMIIIITTAATTYSTAAAPTYSTAANTTTTTWNLIFVVPCIMLNSEINPTRCNNCVYSSQWLYSTCFG